MELVFAAEYLLPPVGGAEYFTLELLEDLAARGHRVRAVWLGGREEPPPGVEGMPAPEPRPSGGYWRTKRLRREAVAQKVADALADRPADVLLTQLHAAPGAASAAAASGVGTVLFLHSYESLCKHAFEAGGDCTAARDCRSCPTAARLEPDERAELLRSREAHGELLARAGGLVAPSRAVAAATEAWCGRRPSVVPPVVAAPRRVRSAPNGQILTVARWRQHKGTDLLEPLARGLPHRRLRIAGDGLPTTLQTRLRALPNVELVPPAPVERLLEGAAVTLVPSQGEEAFGRVAFESMAAGVPVLASDAGGLREHVPPSLLVRPRGDADAWIRAVRALEKPERWERARAEGLRAAESVLRARPAEAVERLLLRIASRQAPSPGE